MKDSPGKAVGNREQRLQPTGPIRPRKWLGLGHLVRREESNPRPASFVGPGFRVLGEHGLASNVCPFLRSLSADRDRRVPAELLPGRQPDGRAR